MSLCARRTKWKEEGVESSRKRFILFGSGKASWLLESSPKCTPNDHLLAIECPMLILFLSFSFKTYQRRELGKNDYTSN